MLAIFVSACVALYETVLRFIHPQHLTHLWVLATAGLTGFIGNELAAQVRLRAEELPVNSAVARASSRTSRLLRARHAGGRGFESRRSRSEARLQTAGFRFSHLARLPDSGQRSVSE